MDNYVKGRNVESEDNLENFGIPGINIPPKSELLVITGKCNTKSLLIKALKMYKEDEIIAICGSGSHCKKVITLVEKIKRRYKKALQYTNISFKRVDEYWEPKTEDLDELKVERDIPKISIVLSNKSIDCSVKPQIDFDNFLYFDDERHHRSHKSNERFGKSPKKRASHKNNSKSTLSK